MQHITIIGLGLIGGSLSLALRSADQQVVVTGWDRSAEVVERARTIGAIDQIAPDLPHAVQHADLVIIATPVLAIRSILDTIAPHLTPGAIVSDVASTKADVLAWASALLPDQIAFVGGHPMAGSEQHGIDHARSDLLHGAVYCLTPRDGTPPEAIDLIERLVRSIGARPLTIAAAEHDAFVATISHVPFVLSAALVQLAAGDPRWPAMRQLAATGFRDTTRLASGDVLMHRDICVSNAAAIGQQLRDMAQLLATVADHIDDPAYLERFFQDAKQQRDAWIAFAQQERSRSDEA